MFSLCVRVCVCVCVCGGGCTSKRYIVGVNILCFPLFRQHCGSKNRHCGSICLWEFNTGYSLNVSIVRLCVCVCACEVCVLNAGHVC